MQKVDKQKNEPNKLIGRDLVMWLFFMAFIIFFALRIDTAIGHSVRTESERLEDYYEAYDSCMQEIDCEDNCTLKGIEAYN